MTRILLSVLLLFSLAGCGSEGERAGKAIASGPTLIPIDSVLFPEGDHLYLGNPFAPAFDPDDGSVYVSDLHSLRVLRIDRAGQLVAEYGRPGDGPGELRGGGIVFVADDSTVAVEDRMKAQLNLFDRETAEYRTTVPLPGLAGLVPPVTLGDGFLLPVIDRNRRNAFVRWMPGDTAVHSFGELPAEYHASVEGGRPSYANHMLTGAVVSLDTILVRGWQPRNNLTLYEKTGRMIGTLDVPVARRRGVPENLQHLYDHGSLGHETLTLNSRLRQLHAMPDGGLAFTHHDQEILSLDGPIPVLSAQVWVGVIAPDLIAACVDAPVPVSADARAMEAFRGDTLFVLDRRVVEAEARMETWLVMYRLDTEQCDWIAIEPFS